MLPVSANNNEKLTNSHELSITCILKIIAELMTPFEMVLAGIITDTLCFHCNMCVSLCVVTLRVLVSSPCYLLLEKVPSTCMALPVLAMSLNSDNYYKPSLHIIIGTKLLF